MMTENRIYDRKENSDITINIDIKSQRVHPWATVQVTDRFRENFKVIHVKLLVACPTCLDLHGCG